MDRPLAGIRVLELGHVFQGPYCGTLLSYLGADVVKVEPPTGESLRARSTEADPADRIPIEFQWMNPTKRGITLDLKFEGGRDVFETAVAETDVLVENFSTGAMERLGLGYATLSEINPGLVYGHASAYGSDGPYRDFAAYDATIQAMVGIMETTGFPDGPPVKIGPSLVDILGATHLAAGILAALFQREFTGEGQYVESSLFEAVVPGLGSQLAAWIREDDVPPRVGNQHPGLDMAPFNLYEVADGSVLIVCMTNPQWERLVSLMDREELIDREGWETPSARAEHRAEIDEIVQKWVADREKRAVVEALSAENIPSAYIQTVPEVATDEHLHHRGMLNELDNRSAVGKDQVLVPGCPIHLESERPAVTPAPELGEDTRAVLAELGYSPAEIDDLARQGAF